MQKSIHILVSGRVQGVYFRASAKQRALQLGLRGMVRNLRDGRVEIIAQGPNTALETFVEWCRLGPEHARVDELQSEDWPESDEFESFSISYSDR